MVSVCLLLSEQQNWAPKVSTMTRKTIKELNVVIEVLEEKMKAFEHVAKILETFTVSDIVKKFEEIYLIGAKMERIKIDFMEKETSKAEELPKIKTQYLKCRNCEKEFTLRKQLKQHIAEYHAITIDCKFCDTIPCKRNFYNLYDFDWTVKTANVQNNALIIRISDEVCFQGSLKSAARCCCWIISWTLGRHLVCATKDI